MTKFRDEIKAWREEMDDETIKTPDRRRTVEHVAMAVAEACAAEREEKALQKTISTEANLVDSGELASGRDSMESIGEEEVPVEILLFRKESALMASEAECNTLKRQLLEVQKGMLGGAPGPDREAKEEEANRLEAQIDELNAEIQKIIKQVTELRG